MTSEKDAVNILGKETVSNLSKWYHKALDNNFDYVVFMTRRSYMLALIMEKIAEKEMEDVSSAVFLTDASVLLHCRKMAQTHISTGRFPKILICNDILVHGCNLNHLIDSIEDKLINLLQGCDPDRIRSDLVKSIQINILKIASGISLLHGRYAKKLDTSLITEPKPWRKLSNDLSILVFESEIANTYYICSMKISEECFKRIRDGEDGFIHTNYRGMEQYTKIWHVGKGNHIKALLSLRFIKYDNGYKTIPFVFLPDLSSSSTEHLVDLFVSKINVDDFTSLMKFYHSHKGQRNYNEFLTLLLSKTILKDICQKYDIPADDDFDNEIRKLARNYNFYTLRQTENCLRSTLKRYLFSINELMRELERIIPDDESVFLGDITSYSPDRSGETDTDDIRKVLEKYFYEKYWKEERKMYILKNRPYSPNIDYSKRTVTGVFDVLCDMIMPQNEAGLDIYIAYMLQMMDTEIIEISSYPPNDMEVNGFKQFVNIGKQSAAIFPTELYDYIPLLSYMQDECDKWHIDLESEIDDFCEKHREWFSTERIWKFKSFINLLKEIGQKVSDWDWNYDGNSDFFRNGLKSEYRRYISGITQTTH